VAFFYYYYKNQQNVAVREDTRRKWDTKIRFRVLVVTTQNTATMTRYNVSSNSSLCRWMKHTWVKQIWVGQTLTNQAREKHTRMNQ